MRKIVVVLLLCVVLLIGCAAHVHNVGRGAQGNDSTEARQWYILFGLVPLNEVDTSEMADGAGDYTIKTEQNALDVVMNIFTSYVSVVSRTVTVTK